MGATMTRSCRDARTPIDGEESSDSADSSDDESATSMSDNEGSEKHGEKATFLERVSACFHRTLGFNFSHKDSGHVTSRDSSSMVLLMQGKDQEVDESYEVNWGGKPLGEGGYASVFKATDRKTQRVHALKSISKAMLPDSERLKKEIDIMVMLDHPNIAKLFQVFEDRRKIYLIVELCEGGELFDRVIEQGHLSEPEAASIMQQIFKAVHYTHDKMVCHRDLKPENFLFQRKGPVMDNLLKMIDFGIASVKKANKQFHTKTGTPYYVAPEVCMSNASYGFECDLWSCGVIMYVLLSGRLPFKGTDEAATLTKVVLGKFSFPPEYFDQISQDAKTLIRWLLKKNPSHRCTAEQAVNHTWTRNRAPAASPAPLQANHLDSLRRFHSENVMKKAALQVVARQIEPGKIEQLRNIFMQLDEDGNGILTSAELTKGLHSMSISVPEELRVIVEAVDADKSGNIDYSEFIAATLQRKQYLQEDAVWNAFRFFDRNGDGKISQKELATVLSSNSEALGALGKNKIDDIMRDVDVNGDGAIDFDEFLAMMRQ